MRSPLLALPMRRLRRDEARCRGRCRRGTSMRPTRRRSCRREFAYGVLCWLTPKHPREVCVRIAEEAEHAAALARRAPEHLAQQVLRLGSRASACVPLGACVDRARPRGVAPDTPRTRVPRGRVAPGVRRRWPDQARAGRAGRGVRPVRGCRPARRTTTSGSRWSATRCCAGAPRSSDAGSSRASSPAPTAGARATRSPTPVPIWPRSRPGPCVDGDEWVIDGQKIWTSLAADASWIFLLARTDPRRPGTAGITFLLCPMDQPGIEVRPIEMLNQRARVLRGLLHRHARAGRQRRGRGRRRLDRWR